MEEAESDEEAESEVDGSGKSSGLHHRGTHPVKLTAVCMSMLTVVTCEPFPLQRKWMKDR